MLRRSIPSVVCAYGITFGVDYAEILTSAANPFRVTMSWLSTSRPKIISSESADPTTLKRTWYREKHPPKDRCERDSSAVHWVESGKVARLQSGKGVGLQGDFMQLCNLATSSS